MMCLPCSAAYDRWLDYRSAPAPVLVQIGSPTAANVVSARTARASDHYALVRRQLDGIRDNCKAGWHAQANA